MRRTRHYPLNSGVTCFEQKKSSHMLAAHPMSYELAKEFDRLSLRFLNNTQGVIVELEPILEREIKDGQKDDEKINEIR